MIPMMTICLLILSMTVMEIFSYSHPHSESEYDCCNDEPIARKVYRVSQKSPIQVSATLPGPSSLLAAQTPQTQPAVSTIASAESHAHRERQAATRILSLSKIHLFGQTKSKWSGIPTVSIFSRNSKRNISTGGNPGPQGNALHVKSEIDCFSLLWKDEMLREIITQAKTLLTKQIKNLEHCSSAIPKF